MSARSETGVQFTTWDEAEKRNGQGLERSIFSVQDSTAMAPFLMHPLVCEFLNTYVWVVDSSQVHKKECPNSKNLFQIFVWSSELATKSNSYLWSALVKEAHLTVTNNDAPSKSELESVMFTKMVNFLRTIMDLDNFWIKHTDLVFGSTNPKQKTTFGMPCYWTGEGELGGIDGVYSTEPGWHISISECVEVSFDPQIVTYEALVKEAQDFGFFPMPHNEQQTQSVKKMQLSYKSRKSWIPIGMVSKNVFKYYLTNTSSNCIQFLPLTVPQACRLNAAVYQGVKRKSLEALMSPGQRELWCCLERLGTSELRKLISLGDLPYHLFTRSTETIAKYHQSLIAILPKQ